MVLYVEVLVVFHFICIFIELLVVVASEACIENVDLALGLDDFIFSVIIQSALVFEENLVTLDFRDQLVDFLFAQSPLVVELKILIFKIHFSFSQS
jgi:hypothetical protein